MATPPKQYVRDGEVVSDLPFSVRVRGFFDDAFAFGGLYLTTLFSLDAYAAAESSSFSTRNRTTLRSGARPNGGPSGGRSTGTGGSSGRPGSGGFGARGVGRMADLRNDTSGPAWRSCGSCCG